MRTASLRFYAGCVAALATSAAAFVACGSDESTSAFNPREKADSGTRDGAPTNSDGGLAPSDAASTVIPADGIVIVHAASFGAFRLCFEAAPQRRPIPAADLLPDSNLLGVEVGSIVRIDPLPMAPGRTFAYAVDDIKSLYGPGKQGPSCEDLAVTASAYTHEVGTITQDLSRGVHLLVLRGSLATQDLRIQKITLAAFNREPGKLPIQVLPLAQNLDKRAGNRTLGIGAGLLPSAADGGDAGPLDVFVEGAFPFGVVAPTMPVSLDYDPNDEASYATSGFVVTLGSFLDGGADAGPPEVILEQSLADIQRLSAPRALPAPWFNAASSYVLLLLGNAQEPDAAASELTRLHFLAVPIAAPASADASIEDAASTD